MKKFIFPLIKAVFNWRRYSLMIALKARKNHDMIGSASVDYLMYFGYLVYGYMWVKMAAVASEKLKAGEGCKEFNQGKVQTAKFYFARMLPRVKAHAVAIQAGANTLMDIDPDAIIVA